MSAQPDYLQLVAIAEHTTKLASQGFEVLGMDISGPIPVFTVRQVPPLPVLTGYEVQVL